MNSVSLNQIAYNLLNSLRGGKSTNSEYLSLEQVKYAVKTYRSLFIRRDFQRNFNRSRMFEQDLGMLEIGSVDSAESASYVSGIQVKRSNKKIPAPVRLKQSEAITWVGSADKTGKPIPLIDDVRGYWQGFSKYTYSSTYATYRDGYIYVYGYYNGRYINVRGVFEDPEKVHNFTRENGLDLYDEDSPFPISQDMLQAITKGLLDGELSIAISTANDTTTDTLQND